MSKARAGAPGQVRIIAGQWRSRRLPVPDAKGLRPTPDRVRETLFNWLAPILPGAMCVDAFAGSGALGFEAASRAAGRVLMIERDAKVATHLRQQQKALPAPQVEVLQADALTALASLQDPVDIVFLDPPYGQGLLPPALQALLSSGQLKPSARLYLEYARQEEPPALPAGWQMLKQTQAGDVAAMLVGQEPN
ncbi:16S rRNA (guanine966-N2)-methyltransferase [Ectothiorhodosinus mongolicus]|uniref:Ribosomal RNA small subunit methyltransferase D n=1 Tax=Ectothiorhodosinus mongolicus TaxID=233100 RepID=A0A1R3VUP7_9GAMM|nr:16S rRNA (guanine(966)-N(2))-methyltransferase RsmD [Ectothiorhodosinus mongolicus]ULX56845.1 16S rRNA (guanine(966)-N(2))-methyltransferase RsmD [Ectothiorhodosinus mongolicus]SIT68610.1 16S rRNA (guanine966-N2)-methyltransferase [Ectothiorhodosinus mongolicus]